MGRALMQYRELQLWTPLRGPRILRYPLKYRQRASHQQPSLHTFKKQASSLTQVCFMHEDLRSLALRSSEITLAPASSSLDLIRGQRGLKILILPQKEISRKLKIKVIETEVEEEMLPAFWLQVLHRAASQGQSAFIHLAPHIKLGKRATFPHPPQQGLCM